MTVEASKAPSQVQRPPPLVVIADHDADSRLIIPAALEHAGYRCISTAVGEEAVTLAEQESAALLITELYLPACGLPCIVHAVRGRRATSALRVLVYTAHAMPEDRQWALDAGCDSLLYKPTPVRELLATVDQLLA